jgi:hypothetical protein
MAEELAPVEGQKTASNSMHDAQLSTERLMRGLPLIPTPEMVYEDYVLVWLADLELMTNRAQQMGGMATPEQLLGWGTMVQQLQNFIKVIAQNDEEKPKVRQFEARLSQCTNLIKAFQQRLQQQAKAAAQNGNGAGVKPQDVVQAQFEAQRDAVKLRNMEKSHGARTAQKQVQFEQKLQQQDRATNAEIQRENAKATHELLRNSMRSLSEPPEDNA